jgi:hypothetical protein
MSVAGGGGGAQWGRSSLLTRCTCELIIFATNVSVFILLLVPMNAESGVQAKRKYVKSGKYSKKKFCQPFASPNNLHFASIHCTNESWSCRMYAISFSPLWTMNILDDNNFVQMYNDQPQLSPEMPRVWEVKTQVLFYRQKTLMCLINTCLMHA